MTTENKTQVGFDLSGIDPNFKEHAGRGIGRYVSELDIYFKKNQSVSEDVEIGRFDYHAFSLPKIVDSAINLLPAGRQTIRQQICYPFQISKLKQFDFLHFPAHMDAPSWCAKPFVITVLDLIPLVHRDLYEAEVPSLRFKFARWLELRAIKSAVLVLAISECTARDVVRILGIPRERVIVTPLGVDEKLFIPRSPNSHSVKQKYSIPAESPILVYVGGIDPRKNVPGLIEIFSKILADRVKNNHPRPVLALAGKTESDRNYPKLIAQIKSLGLENDIRILGFVPDDDLKELFAVSALFLFPSLYEGFGLPPLEAMASGLPVVSSNVSAMAEVLGDAGRGFNPTDQDAAVRACLEILDNAEYAKSLSQRGIAQAKKFSWTETGVKTVRAYEQAERIIRKEKHNVQ